MTGGNVPLSELVAHKLCSEIESVRVLPCSAPDHGPKPQQRAEGGGSDHRRHQLWRAPDGVEQQV